MTQPVDDRTELTDACAHALLGPAADDLHLAGVETPEALVTRLTAAGWAPDRIADLANGRRSRGMRWPIPQRLAAGAGVGFAQFHAWVARCLELLSLDAANAGVRNANQPLDAEDHRLIAERPPHHGSVG